MTRLAPLLLCATSAVAAEPQNFLFMGSELAEHTNLLERPDISGAQVVYSWKSLEPAERSHVVQYVNFWPCGWNDEHGYFTRFFEIAAREKIGAGGPDIVPHRPAQMKNSYPLFNRYKGRLSLVAMAVQEPTLTYTNPRTQRKFTREEFIEFARDYLGVDVIFWSTASPWLVR